MTSEPLFGERMGHVLLQGMQEVLGEEGLRSLFGDGAGGPTLSAPEPDEAMKLLESRYGAVPGRGIALRIGRACLPYGLREFGDMLGVDNTSFRLLPFPAKLKSFAAALANLLQAQTPQRVTVERTDGKLLWHIEHCVLCGERHTSAPACQLAVGLAEEALYWMSGGKIFQVEEVACIARGDPRCTLQIDEAPIS